MQKMSNKSKHILEQPNVAYDIIVDERLILANLVKWIRTDHGLVETVRALIYTHTQPRFGLF